MRSKFNCILPLVIIVLIFAQSGCQSVVSQQSQSGQTVSVFLTKLQNGNEDKAAEMLTNTPPSADQVLMLKLDKIKESTEEVKVEKKNTAETESREKIDSGQTKSLTKKRDNKSPQELMQSVMRPFDRQLVFDKIISVAEYGDEAKVVGSFIRKGYANTNYNFLLVKEDGDWKIFDIYLNNGPEFDLYEYWAVKRK